MRLITIQVIFVNSECLFPCLDIVPILLHDWLDVWAFAAQYSLSIWFCIDEAFWKDNVFADLSYDCLKLYLLLNLYNPQELGIKVYWNRSQSGHAHHGNRRGNIDQTSESSIMDCVLNVPLILWENESKCSFLWLIFIFVDCYHAFPKLLTESPC